MVAAVSPRWGSVSPDLARVNFYFTKCFLGFVFGRFVRRVCARHGARKARASRGQRHRRLGGTAGRERRTATRPSNTHHARRDSPAPGSAVARPLALAARRASSPRQVPSGVMYSTSGLICH